MTKTQMSLVGDSKRDRENKLDAQRTINMYVLDTPEGKFKRILAPMPGLLKFVEFPEGSQIRAIYTYKGVIYAVVSNKIWKIAENGTKDALGTISTAFGYVGIAENNTQLIFVDGAKGYTFTPGTSTFAEITSPGFPSGPQDVTVLDGYFIVNKINTNQFFVSALNDGTQWDALNFESMQSRTDIIVGVRTLHRRLYLFGKKTTEVWYNAGASDFPFRRDNNALLEYGCASPESITLGYQRLFWLAGDENGVGSVMMTDGTAPVIVSTPAIDYHIQKYSKIEDASGTIYKIDGVIFYELSFTTANKTWILNVNNMTWTEGQDLSENRKIIRGHCFLNLKHYVGSYKDPILYLMSSEYFSDDGAAIRRRRITGHFNDENLRIIRISRANIDALFGVGISDDVYDDPHIYLSWSKDGGETYSAKRKKSLGKSGDRMIRCLFHLLGISRDWIFDIEVVSKNKVFLMALSLDYEVTGR